MTDGTRAASSLRADLTDAAPVRQHVAKQIARGHTLTAVAGLAHPLAQSNVHAADAVLSAVADALGVES